jgi:predicted permease
LRLALRSWPAERRARDGHALYRTTEQFLREAREVGAVAFVWEALREAGAMIAGGLSLRLEQQQLRLADLRRGWTGDVRFATRMLLRSPGFTTVAVATLAVGIGANAATFSLVDSVLLRPPPYESPDELVFIWNTVPGSNDRITVAGPDVQVLGERVPAFSGVGFASRGVDGAIEASTGDGAQHVVLSEVTWGLFDLLAVEALLGRTFDEREAPGNAASGGGPVVVISYDTWRRVFGGDPAIVGGETRVNGIPMTVLGVMPEEFHLIAPPEAAAATGAGVWGPMSIELSELHRTDNRLLDQDSDNSGVAVARLAPSATVGIAQAQADRVAEDLRIEVEAYAGSELGFSVRSMQSDATAHARGLILALFAGAGIVLLVACLNIATLLIARGMDRGGELAVRVALGASRARLARQLVTESLALVALGGVGALGLAHVALLGLTRWLPVGLTVGPLPGLDVRAMLFAGGLAAVASVVFGLIPWTQHNGKARHGLAAAGRRVSPRSRRRRNSLVIAEIALSVVLVLGAGLLMRTVQELGRVDPGFSPEGALSFSVSLRTPERYRSPRDRAQVMRDIADGVGRLPGVEAVGLSGVLPLAGDRWTQPYGLPGQASSEWHENRADFRMVSSGYFDALGARLLEGRVFSTDEDLNEGDRVVVVDEKLARRVAPEGSALGAVIGVPVDGAAVEARIVGVVEHVRHDRLEADGREAVFVPYRQEASRDVAFVVRTSGEPTAVMPSVRSIVRDIDPGIPVYNAETLSGYVAKAVAPRRFALVLLAAFAALGLLCSALGLYGVVAFDVSRRTRDIGLRMAVGAGRGRVVRDVLADAMRLTVMGLGVGVILAQPAVRGLQTLVFGVSLNDPVLWSGVVSLVVALSILASWVPARRASLLDPTEALRAE